MKCFKFLFAILSVILFSSCAEKDKKSLDKITVENTRFNKEIVGRFNLFYKTTRKGEIYGWITDEVNNPQ